MPRRKIPLITDEIYHVFNRGIDHRPTFFDQRELGRALELISFYRFSQLPVRYSLYLTWSNDRQKELIDRLLSSQTQLVEILAYCFMPNHFHFLIRQNKNNGITKFLSQFQNSYTRYHNLKHQRIGPLFLDQFKAIRIETEEQLLHVSRYIHLNPYSSHIVKDLDQLKRYRWSSLNDYLNLNSDLCNPQSILAGFKNKLAYQKFVFNQSDYQRQLEKIKHLLLE